MCVCVGGEWRVHLEVVDVISGVAVHAATRPPVRHPAAALAEWLASIWVERVGRAREEDRVGALAGQQPARGTRLPLAVWNGFSGSFC